MRKPPNNATDPRSVFDGVQDSTYFESSKDLHSTIYNLIEKQKKGEKGELQQNGHNNIFFVRLGDLLYSCLVRFWNGIGNTNSRWTIDLFPLDNPVLVGKDDRVCCNH